MRKGLEWGARLAPVGLASPHPGAGRAEGGLQAVRGVPGGCGGKTTAQQKSVNAPLRSFSIFFHLPSLSSFPHNFFYFFLYRIIEADYNGVIRMDNRPITVY